MQRAIAGGRRACQVGAVAAALLLARAPAAAQDMYPPNKTYFEARAADGVTVAEGCLSDPVFASSRPCGPRAKKAVEVITRLRTLLGPFPQKRLTVEYAVTREEQKRFVAVETGKIQAGDDVMAVATDDLVIPDFLPRETARQWLLGAALRWRGGDVWLAEGLPEYLAWRDLQSTNPEVARTLVAEAMRDSVAGSRERPAFGFWGGGSGQEEATIAASRQRGLLILRTLETVIDRERVDRVLPLFLRRYAGRPVSAVEFERVCEEVAGRNLSWFFTYFGTGGGVPEIEMRRVPSESAGVAAGEISVKGLPAEGSVRVEMTVRTAQGAVQHSVATHGAVTPFTVNVPGPALSMTMDPEQRILRWTEAARRWKAQLAILATLTGPPAVKDPPGAIDAYRRALGADPADASLRAQALHERLGKIEFERHDLEAAMAELDMAINGHALSPLETYLNRGRAYLSRIEVWQKMERRDQAKADARAGLDLPGAVLLQEANPDAGPSGATLGLALRMRQALLTRHSP